MRIAMLHSRIRAEEKLLIDRLESRGVEYQLIDLRTVSLGSASLDWTQFDAVLERCVSHTMALATLRYLESNGLPCINSYRVANICGDKLATTLALEEAGVPTPETRIAFDTESALESIEELGYPVVLKPCTGSWGRLIAKVNDRQSAEGILEHKATLGSPQHSVFYIQEYVSKPGRDIRSFVIGGETVCAIYRTSDHWITNTARGATASACVVSADLDEISRRASAAVGGGIIAVDLLETSSGSLLVNEVNYTIEFRNSITPTGVDIPAKIIDYVTSVVEKNSQANRDSIDSRFVGVPVHA
ncbi:MAG: lysine biosynthesis protein LysX [Myxococcota bacterium]|nr:lysine biosynthesis protein LysX [Myxococcota bacterium]